MAEEKTKTEQLIAEAKKRLEACIDSENWLRGKCLDDLIFLSGSPDEPEKQWGAKAVAERMRDGRPALVVNRLDQFVQHITNQQRQNRVSAKVFPVDDKGDIDTAEVMQGLLRNIEYSSRAEIAYDTAEFYAVAMGFGYWLLSTDYSTPYTIDQDIKVLTVKNPFQVYLGPHEMPDGSDAEYGFKVTDLTKDEYESEYGSAEDVKSFDDVRGLGDTDWCDEEKIRIVEYRYTEYEDDTVLKLKNGTEVLQSSMSKAKYERLKKSVVDSRETKIPTFKWCKLTAADVLDETILPFNGIGIVKVTGSELTVNGRTILKGIVRNMKDAQRQYNFMLTEQTEAAMDKGAVVAVEGQIEGHEEAWGSRLRKNQPVLPVKPTSIAGQPAPMPTRLAPDPTIAAKSEARMMAAEDLKALTGIYDAALGNKSNEQSGRAILSRQQQSDVANFHFQDNLTRSISHSTRMMVNGMPVVYSGKRVVRTIGEDDAHKIVAINQIFDKNGQEKKHDFTIGKYDAICTAGPSFSTKRQEGAALLIELSRSAPVIMNAAPDLLIKCLDIPYSQEISERLKKTLPPQLQDEQDGQQPIPPQVMQQMNKMQQDHAALNAYAQQVEKENEQYKAGAQVKQMEIESRERIEILKLEVSRDIAEITTKAQDSITRAKLDADLNAKLQVQEHANAHEVSMRAAEVGHEVAMADKSHGQVLEQGQQSAANQSAQSAQDAEQAAANQPSE